MASFAPIIYVFHGRFPDPRAAALFAAQEAVSFAATRPVTFLVPTRDTTNLEAARKLYHLPESVTLVALPAKDYFRHPFLKQFAFIVSAFSFGRSVAAYLKAHEAKGQWVVTADHIPALYAARAGARVMLEVHDFPTAWNPLWQSILKKADLLLATNALKKERLIKKFSISEDRILVEPNGVDLARFSSLPKKEIARAALSLPLAEPIVLYTGNLYSWKGVDTLVDASAFLPHALLYIVGGADEDRARLRARVPGATTIHFVGRVPHEEVPTWLAAADVLVLPNTAREQISALDTSPMKLFEYMASGRPIVASDLPSVREILSEQAGVFVVADEPSSLAAGIAQVLANPESAVQRAAQARIEVAPHSWGERAKRVLAHLL